MKTLIVIEDDLGIMSSFIIADYENVGEAQIAAIDDVIEWHEDSDNHDEFTDMVSVKEDIRMLEEFKSGVKDGQYDENDDLELSGFFIKAI